MNVLKIHLDAIWIGPHIELVIQCGILLVLILFSCLPCPISPPVRNSSGILVALDSFTLVFSVRVAGLSGLPALDQIAHASQHPTTQSCSNYYSNMNWYIACTPGIMGSIFDGIQRPLKVSIVCCYFCALMQGNISNMTVNSSITGHQWDDPEYLYPAGCQHQCPEPFCHVGIQPRELQGVYCAR